MDTRAAWAAAFSEALERDAWGLPEEAVETWQRLRVAAAAEYNENLLKLPPRRREAVGDFARILEHRIAELRRGTRPASAGAGLTSNGTLTVGLTGMESLRPFVAGLLVSDVQVPPGLLQAARGGRPPSSTGGAQPSLSPRTPRGRGRSSGSATAGVGERQALSTGLSLSAAAAGANPAEVAMGGAEGGALRDVNGRGPGAEHGTLRPPPSGVAAGDTSLSIFIDNWQFKGADRLVDASVAVSVRDASGRLLGAYQETAAPVAVTAQELRWGATVHLQTPLSALGDGWAIFFELRHWKAAKHKRSTKAWALLEQDEVAPLLEGTARTARATAAAALKPFHSSGGGSGDARSHCKALEQYAKPPLFSQAARNRPKLFTARPEYLHIALHLTPGGA